MYCDGGVLYKAGVGPYPSPGSGSCEGLGGVGFRAQKVPPPRGATVCSSQCVVVQVVVVLGVTVTGECYNV